MPVGSKPQRESFHRGDTRPAAIEAAAALVAAQGRDAITLRGVADALGINHRALYRQFASREELLFAVAECGFVQLADLLETVAALRSDQRPTALARLYAGFALDQPHLYDLMFSLPLRTWFHSAHGVGPPLRRVVKAAAAAVQNEGPNTGQSRLRVMRIWGLVHGLVGLYRAGAFKARSNRLAIEFIVDAARPLVSTAADD